MRILALILIFTLTISLLANAQKTMRYSDGYVIKAGDTLRGEIQSALQRKLQTTCVFRAKGSSNFTEYSPLDVTGFLVKDLGFFESKANIAIEGAEKQDYFLQVIDKGRATLYFLVDEKGRPHYFIQKENSLTELTKKVTIDRNEAGQMTQQIDYLYRGVLLEMLKDCPQPVSKLGLSRKSLSRIVYNYNKCINPQHVAPAKEQSRIFAGITAGMIGNNLEMKNLKNELPVKIRSGKGAADISDYTRSFSFASSTYGLNFEMALGTDKHFSIFSGMLFTAYQFSSEQLTIDHSNLTIPLNLKYRFLLNSRLRPYVSIGVVVPFSIKDKTSSSAIPVFKSDGSPLLDDQGEPYFVEPLGKDRFEVAKLHFSAAAGLELVLTENSKLFSQVQLEKAGMYNSAYLDLNATASGVLLGYSYRIGN